MAGYILGLGDRHPSNLMLERVSGRVVHIDFGDCFEITKQRSKYPEIIPFRLTRMMTAAMGYTGIAGTYRVTCEKVNTVASLITNFYVLFFLYLSHPVYLHLHRTQVRHLHYSFRYPHFPSTCQSCIPIYFISRALSLYHSLTHSLTHTHTHSHSLST